MKFIFWNVKKQKREEPLIELADKTGADVLFLAECSEELVEQLNSSFVSSIAAKVSKQPRINAFIRRHTISCKIDLDIRQKNDRYVFYHLSGYGIDVNFVVVHFSSKLYSYKESQQSDAQDFMTQVRELEKKYSHQRTVIIGDFNMNPFDSGMFMARIFNATCSLEIAFHKKTRKYQGIDYSFFYNPCWKNYAGLGNGIYGTYYYDSPENNHIQHWNNLDQVLLRPDILENYEHNFAVLHDVLNYDIRKKNSIFDHYPILLELKEKTLL
ncbi:MAG: endonuclease/exonuclease/phosphatase family protein [Planctomycetaceae bacterium]|jgi:hypothetical protein|nr:endonuclease/exonuclease/phosphatase family protein [Planctomycetaceae bacterium]